jgi:hypothetical protein
MSERPREEHFMRYDRNLNPEWGYLVPSPSVMRSARLIALATIIGAIVGAAAVFSLPNRPFAEESVAARTLVVPDSKQPVITSRSVAVEQPTEPQQVKLVAAEQNEQKAPPAAAGGAPPLPSELATTSTPRRPNSVAVLAEAPAVKASPSGRTFNDTIAIEPAPEPAPKPQSKKPRVTSRAATPRYDAWGYNGYFDRPRYGYEPRHEYGPRYGSSGSFARGPYY